MRAPAILAGPAPFETLAISVRQPWAWALIHAGKDIENRTQLAPWAKFRGERLLIHAAKGMSQDEYANARAFMSTLCIRVPPARELLRGGVIGSVFLSDVVTRSASAWFMGPVGLVVERPIAFKDPVACKGELGVFRMQVRVVDGFETPKPWMLAA